MKPILALCLALPLCSCLATNAQLDRVQEAQAELSRVLADETATQEDVAAAVATVKEEAALLDDAAKEDAKGWEDILAGGSATGIGSALLLHLFRNRQRRLRGEPVDPGPPA